MIALVDFTAENGATRVAPGSHRWPHDRMARPTSSCPPRWPPGRPFVYLGSTLHGGGANVTTDVRRRGMHVSYCLGWLRTEENQYLSTPIDVVRTLPRESQALLGYAAHDGIAAGGGYLGAVRVQDPLALLAAQIARSAGCQARPVRSRSLSCAEAPGRTRPRAEMPKPMPGGPCSMISSTTSTSGRASSSPAPLAAPRGPRREP